MDGNWSPDPCWSQTQKKRQHTTWGFKVCWLSSSYPTDLVNNKWFPATDIWTAKSYKKNLCLSLSWVTLTRCSPLVSLNSLPSFRPPSTPTLQARPSLDVFGCMSFWFSAVNYLYSNLIWSMVHPLLAVIFVTEYRFSWLLLLLLFLTSLTVVIFCFAIARSFKCPFLQLARPIWVLYQLPGYQQRQEQCANSTLGGNHPPPQKQRHTTTQSREFLFIFVVMNLPCCLLTYIHTLWTQ